MPITIRSPTGKPKPTTALQPAGVGFTCADLGEGVYRWSGLTKNIVSPADERAFALNLLLTKGKITSDHINLLKSWRYSGFQVFCGPRIHPRNEEPMENLARYIIRASFSQERMTYLPDESKIIYRSKDNRREKNFEALDWLAAMASHIPNQGEQKVRYYGFYSNASRGHRQKENEDTLIPYVLEPDENKKPNRNWARLIQKIGACPGLDPGRWTP